jgi:hypothetical protein
MNRWAPVRLPTSRLRCSRRLLDDAGIPSVSLGGYGPQIGSCKRGRSLSMKTTSSPRRRSRHTITIPDHGTDRRGHQRLSSDLARLTRQARTGAGGRFDQADDGSFARST